MSRASTVNASKRIIHFCLLTAAALDIGRHDVTTQGDVSDTVGIIKYTTGTFAANPRNTKMSTTAAAPAARSARGVPGAAGGGPPNCSTCSANSDGILTYHWSLAAILLQGPAACWRQHFWTTASNGMLTTSASGNFLIDRRFIIVYPACFFFFFCFWRTGSRATAWHGCSRLRQPER